MSTSNPHGLLNFVWLLEGQVWDTWKLLTTGTTRPLSWCQATTISTSYTWEAELALVRGLKGSRANRSGSVSSIPFLPSIHVKLLHNCRLCWCFSHLGISQALQYLLELLQDCCWSRDIGFLEMGWHVWPPPCAVRSPRAHQHPPLCWGSRWEPRACSTPAAGPRNLCQSLKASGQKILGVSWSIHTETCNMGKTRN